MKRSGVRVALTSLSSVNAFHHPGSVSPAEDQGVSHPDRSWPVRTESSSFRISASLAGIRPSGWIAAGRKSLGLNGLRMRTGKSVEAGKWAPPVRFTDSGQHG